jgi:hypothetical protein
MKDHVRIEPKAGSSKSGELDRVRIGKRMYRPKPRQLKLEKLE